MDVLETIKKRRTIRQFKSKGIPRKILLDCLDAARLAPSARNLQPLEYLIVDEEKKKEEVFQTLSWGGKLKGGRPDEKHRPTAYIIVLANTEINPTPDFDVGLSVENLVLTARSFGLGSCILGAVDRDKIRASFNVPSHFEIKLVIALGYPAEKSVPEEVEELKEYWRDEKGILHVPKRKLEKIVHDNRF